MHPARHGGEFQKQPVRRQPAAEPRKRDRLAAAGLVGRHDPRPGLVGDFFHHVAPCHRLGRHALYCLAIRIAAGDDRQIRLANLPSLELPGELPRSPRRGSKEHHSRHAAIEPVWHADITTSVVSVELSPQPGLRRRDSHRRLRGQTCRLPHRDHTARLLNDMDRVHREACSLIHDHHDCTL